MTVPPDILREFEGLFGGASGQAKPAGDLSLELELSLREAAHGAKRQIELVADAVCPTCAGAGGAAGATVATCLACDAKGMITKQVGFLMLSQTCTICHGNRRRWSAVCVSCQGRGSRPVTSSLEVVIPPGVSHQQVMRLPGKGSDHGDGPGDLYVRLTVTAHPSLVRVGDDLTANLAVDPELARTGGVVEVPWLDGSARVSIPPGSKVGTVIRLTGWGMVRLGAPYTPPPVQDQGVYRAESTHRGDLLVTLTQPARVPTPPHHRAALVAAAISVAAAVAAFLLLR